MAREGQKAVTFYLPNELVEQIDVWADREIRTRTNWIEVVIRDEITRRRALEAT